jgi:transcriptional regulator with XRE-family HTH domain
MVRQVADDPEFVQDFEDLLARRAIITDLMALRAAAGLSQQAIAVQLKCTQSRVSKLEAGNDAELRLGDLARYADALGYETRIVLFKKGKTPVDEVKYHAFSIKRLLEDLAALVGEDETMAKGALGFFREAAFNLAKFIRGAADKLPQRPTSALASISLEIADSDEGQLGARAEEDTGAATRTAGPVS